MEALETAEELSVFDFDGTLVDTPVRETGVLVYEQKTGQPWPHEGWWGQPASLDMDVFDMPSKPDVVADFMAEKANPKSAVILLTGRITKLGAKVKEICERKGYICDAYFFNTGGTTDVVKIKQLNKLLAQYPNIKVVKMWEDRMSHVTIFEQWGKEQCLSGRLTDFQITVVAQNNH